MNNSIWITPAGADPPTDKIIKIFCDSGADKFLGMAGRQAFGSSILPSEYKDSSFGIIQKAPVIDLPHINRLPPGINPHDFFCDCNFFLFYPHPSCLPVCPQLKAVSGSQSILIQLSLKPALKSLENQASFPLSCGHITPDSAVPGVCAPARISVLQKSGKNQNNMPGW